MKKTRGSKLWLIAGIIGVVIINMLLGQHLYADIYKCTDKKGSIFYNDKPCAINKIEKKMKSVKDPKASVKRPSSRPPLWFVLKDLNLDPALSEERLHPKEKVVKKPKGKISKFDLDVPHDL